MGLDEELESMEEVGETDAEWTDQETELEDAEDDEDALFDADEEDAAESDLEHAYDSFMTDNEADYDGWDPDEVPEAIHKAWRAKGAQVFAKSKKVNYPFRAGKEELLPAALALLEELGGADEEE